MLSARVISRRAAISLIGATGVGYALFGPRGRREQHDGRTVLNYWEKWTGHEGRAMQDIVRRFNRGQDRYHVRYFALSSIDQKALVAIAGESPPDILGLWSYNLPAYAQSGALLDLEGLNSAGFGVEHYADALWPLQRYDGRRLGAVNTCGTVALYYNRTLFREAGLDPDRPPQTIDEFDEVADRLTVQQNGRIERIGFLHTEPGWWSWSWGFLFGGQLYDTKTARATAASLPNQRAYRWVQSYPRRYGVKKLNRLRSTFGAYASLQQSFIAGRAAMIAQGPWLANVIAARNPDLEYGVAPLPVDRPLYDPRSPISVLECDLLTIPRGAPDPEGSLQFIAFTQRPDNVERLSLRHAKGSPLRSVSSQFMDGHPNNGIRVHDALLRSPRVATVPRIRTWPQYRDEFNAGMERIWSLTEPADDVLATIEVRAQAAIDRAADQRRRRAGAIG